MPSAVTMQCSVGDGHRGQMTKLKKYVYFVRFRFRLQAFTLKLPFWLSQQHNIHTTFTVGAMSTKTNVAASAASHSLHWYLFIFM